nr:Glutaredoxin like [Ipomoea batatas]
MEGDEHDVDTKNQENKVSDQINSVSSMNTEVQHGNALNAPLNDKEIGNSSPSYPMEKILVDAHGGKVGENSLGEKNSKFQSVGKNVISELQEGNSETKAHSPSEKMEGEKVSVHREEEVQLPKENKPLNTSEKISGQVVALSADESNGRGVVGEDEVSGNARGTNKSLEGNLYEKDKIVEPVPNGAEAPKTEVNRSSSIHSPGQDLGQQGSGPEKAGPVKHFLKLKSAIAVASVFRRLSGKSNDGQDALGADENSRNCSSSKEVRPTSIETEHQDVSQKNRDRSGWSALRLIGIFNDDDKVGEKEKAIEEALQPVAMKGRILLYTRLDCNDCKQLRKFLYNKRLRYIEINIDVYPSRKLELEKIAGSSDVPRVFFNEVLIGGLSEIKSLDVSGKLSEKIEYVVSETPSSEAPLPPLSGEDDLSSSGSIDELALIVRKMKDSIPVNDRFYKMRRFTKCFLGSEAVDFLSEDQYLEREEAIEFGRKLASNLFFHHVLDENLFEDGNHLYCFLDDDPLVSQCQNIPRGIIEVKPKSIVEISSRLRFLSYAVFEAYTSEDRRHVDYRTIHGSEEFARYLRIVEELQRVDLSNMSREEKLAFFINLYNMMTIHAILVMGHPSGAMQRRRLSVDFNYVIGGCTYSLSEIQNGVLRGNQRPPYNLVKPFGAKDKRSMVALPYPEPLSHFALVGGTRSGPALQCYSPGNIDKELMDAAHNFLRSGLIVDMLAKVVYVSKILKWYSADFGNNELEVLKHAANYLEPAESQSLLELLSTTQLKVIYQPFDWGLNH